MVFLIFHSFFVCMTRMHVTCPFQWVGYIAGGRHDWLPWISWLKSSCSNHFQPPQWSSCIVTDESYAFRPFRQKIMRNIEIIRYSSEWNRNRERDAFIEPDGQQYIAERPYCHVSTVIQKILWFLSLEIYCRSENVFIEAKIALHLKYRWTARLVIIFKIRTSILILFFAGFHLIPSLWVYL